jgi:hypothetical protein
MKSIERRDFLKGTATGVFAFTVGGVEVVLSAREARAQNVPFRLLKANEAETIEALGETIVPGARAAGIAHFIDQQLSVPPEEALLEARILNVRPPYARFYRSVIAAVDNTSQALNSGRKFAQLSPGDQHDFVDALRQNKVQGWQGPGASLPRCRRGGYLPHTSACLAADRRYSVALISVSVAEGCRDATRSGGEPLSAQIAASHKLT